MIYAEIKETYGAYAAEMIRQALTPWEFEAMDVEDVVAHFEARAAKAFHNYRSRANVPAFSEGEGTTVMDYATIARRRWQDAEEIAHTVALLIEGRAVDAGFEAVSA